MTGARDILQDYLDMMGAAVMTADYAPYARRVCLPFRLEAETGSIMVATEAELRAGFDTYVSLLRNTHITDFIRLVTHADMMGPRMLSGHYVTHILSRGQRIVPPHLSQITLRLSGADEATIWQGVCITGGIQSVQWPIHAFAISDPRTG